MISANKHTGPDIKNVLAQKGLDANPQYWQQKLNQITPPNVEAAIATTLGTYSFEKLLALVSLAAENYLQQMAQIAHSLTIQRFGRTIRLYAPLYLSNYCANSCLYCGFNTNTTAPRRRLTIKEALQEADIIASEGFSDILLVCGEDRKLITIDYLSNLAKELKTKFNSISIEIYQLSTDEYSTLFNNGIEGVTIYQETYDRTAYKQYHPAGPKSEL